MDPDDHESLQLSDAPLRVIVADDDPLARRALRDVLQAAGITVIAEAGGGREVIELAVYYRPDVVVMDLVMPGIDGLSATQRILERAPEVRIVILTASEDDELGLVTLRAGACGFLRKSIGVEALPRALQRAREGEAIVTRRLTNRLIEELRHVSRDTTGMRPIRSRLTSREWEVLDMLVAGHVDGRDGRGDGRLDRDGPFACQERPAKARRSLSSRGGRGGIPAAVGRR